MAFLMSSLTLIGRAFLARSDWEWLLPLSTKLISSVSIFSSSQPVPACSAQATSRPFIDWYSFNSFLKPFLRSLSFVPSTCNRAHRSWNFPFTLFHYYSCFYPQPLESLLALFIPGGFKARLQDRNSVIECNNEIAAIKVSHSGTTPKLDAITSWRKE